MASLATLLDVDADVLRKQWLCTPMKLPALWKKLSQPRRNILRERGMDFIQFMQIGNYIKHLVFWLLGHFNLRTLTITAAEGKSLTIDEAHVCRIYGLQRGTKRVSDYLEHTVAEVKLWAADLGLPYGNKAFVTLTELSDCMDAEADVEKWFIMYVLYFVGCLVKPLSNQNISLSYLGLFYRRDAPDFENLDWPQHILEVIQNAEEKSYVEYDIFLLMIFFLDMAAVREGDKLPSLTPSIRNWSNAAIEQHLTRLGDVCNLHRIHIVKWDPLETIEKRPRSEGEEKAIEEVGGEVLVAKESGRSVRRRRVEKDREEDRSLVSVEKGAGNSNRTNRCGESVVPHLVTDKPTPDVAEKGVGRETASPSAPPPPHPRATPRARLYAMPMPPTCLNVDHMTADELYERIQWFDKSIEALNEIIYTFKRWKADLAERARFARELSGS